MRKELEVISQAPLFGGIKDEELEKLLVCMDSMRKKYRRQEMILSEEEIPDRIGIVLEGSVQVVQDDVFGNRNIVEKLEKGGLFGAAFACAGVRKSPVSVIAEKDCEICWMHIGKVLSVCPAACPCHQQMLRNLVTSLAGKNVAFSEKITCLSRRSTREKLLSYLSETAKKEKKRHFVIPFNRQELADYLCVDRSAMSAEREVNSGFCKWQGQKLFDVPLLETGCSYEEGDCEKADADDQSP